MKIAIALSALLVLSGIGLSGCLSVEPGAYASSQQSPASARGNGYQNPPASYYDSMEGRAGGTPYSQ